MGWKPGGTLRPPVNFDGPDREWSGEYDPPEGQTVTRSDSAALAAALERVRSKAKTFTEADRKRYIRFFASGPFVVAQPFGLSADIANLEMALRGAHEPVQPSMEPIRPEAGEDGGSSTPATKSRPAQVRNRI
jgi:hypothetical protein